MWGITGGGRTGGGGLGKKNVTEQQENPSTRTPTRHYPVPMAGEGRKEQGPVGTASLALENPV